MLKNEGMIKGLGGFNMGDIEPRTVRTSKVTTDSLVVKKNAVINNLDVGSISASQLTINGQFTTSETSTIDINGNISLNNQQYVLNITQLENALAQASVTGGLSIHLAPGIYPISATLQVPSFTDIRGSGKNTTILKPIDNLNDDIIQITGNEVSIQDLQIDGNGGNQAGNTGANFISIANNVSDITLQNLILFNGESLSDNLLTLVGGTPDTRLGAYIKAVHNTNTVSILNCDIGPNNNETNRNLGLGLTAGIDLGNNLMETTGPVYMHDIIISGCKIEGMPSQILIGRESDTSSLINRILIQNNIIKGVSNGIINFINFFVRFLSSVNELTLSNNSFTDTGLAIGGSGSSGGTNIDNVHITNNIFKNSYGLNINSQKATINNNYFDGIDAHLMCFQNKKSYIIQGNQFKGFKGQASGSGGNCIRVNFSTATSNTTRHCLISDNNIIDNRCYPVGFRYTDGSDTSSVVLPNNFNEYAVVFKNHIQDDRLLANFVGQYDISSSFYITKNTVNTFSTFSDLANNLQSFDTVDIVGLVGNTSITSSDAGFLNQTDKYQIGTSLANVSDQIVVINTFRQLTGYEDNISFRTANAIGIHDFVIPQLNHASHGHQLNIVLKIHGGGGAGDNIRFLPNSTGANYQSFTVGPSAYASVTLDASNEFVTFQWNSPYWDLIKTNGTIA